MLRVRAIFLDWWRAQRLIAKFAAILLATAGISIPLIYISLQQLLKPTFSTLETKSVDDQANRARHSLALYSVTLANNVTDYSVWDSAFEYVLNGNRAFEEETLAPLAYRNMGIDVQAYIANDGTVRWSDAVDRKTATILPDETQFFGRYVTQGAFFAGATSGKPYDDLVKTRRGVVMLHAEPVVRSDESGPSPGFVAMGILLDEDGLSEALQVKVDLDDAPSPAEAAKLQRLPQRTSFVRKADTVTTKIGLVDATGKVIATISYDGPRDALIVGNRAILFATFAMIATMAVLILLVSLAIRRIAVSPLGRLETQVARMRQGDFDISDDLVEGSDEIGRLAREFVNLDRELDAAHAKIERNAYLQGKADSAAGVLHNVRNSLAPLRVFQDHSLQEEQQEFRLQMERAVAELDDPTCPNGRRDALVAFLAKAAMEIARSAPSRRAAMIESKSTVDQIAAILGSYDFDTSGSKPREMFDPLQVMKHEAKALCSGRFSAVTVDLPAEMPPVLGNRVQFGQVVSNLLVNAAEATLAAGRPDPHIRIEAHVSGQEIEIRIMDNGDGIPAEKLECIFERGYSTRKNKSGGLGMHWSAIATKTMGGTLTIFSEGAGKGACASVRLAAAAPGRIAA